MQEKSIKMNGLFYRIMKRAFDILFSISMIILLFPLMFIIYLVVKADGGNAFYGHERIGKNGKKFKCLKFRSMSVNSKELLEKILQTDPIAKQEWKTTFKLKNDPRITRIGHILRKTSLDELPQLLNILKGEMSTVGPRPVTEKEVDMYNNHKVYYLSTKPGLTGLWQVSGRNDVDYETRVLMDKYYVEHWSFLKDILIILKTVKVVLLREGAY